MYIIIMGLLRAIVTAVISLAAVNFLYKHREKLEEYPIIKYLVPHLEGSKCYFIIAIMILLMILW